MRNTETIVTTSFGPVNFNNSFRFSKLYNSDNYTDPTKKNKQNKQNKKINQVEEPKSTKPNRRGLHLIFIVLFVVFLAVNLNWFASNYYGISITKHMVTA